MGLEFIAAWMGLYRPHGAGHGERADDQPGQGLVEYALILSFIAIAVIVALIYFGGRLTTLYSKLGNSVPN